MCHEPSTSAEQSTDCLETVFLPVETVPDTVSFLFDSAFRIGTRSQCIILLLMALFIPCSAKGKCFNTQIGMSIEGGNYRRIRNFVDRECAKECIEDFSCFGYEWNSEEKICYLKSRSTSGKLIAKPNTMVGFCQDDDEVRYRLQDHVIVGPIVMEADDVPDGEECKENCRKVGALYYSWRPNSDNQRSNVVPVEEEEDDEEQEVLGHCECISTMNELRLEYDAFSGFIPIPKHKHRRSILLRPFEI
ncbi:Apple domain-containing protein [Caenorhabditis elegans]|uniref:Apple domain-containing protein n=2 Tax=Caenorhabditis elegans TaxID=6239 RepID=A0A2C9C2X5_CAEEL|nr:Apple domain-containing protein [Caenorhabditis elegans]SOF58770.1 Apple domain-containing protein [Caenorhabditis elegans]|eukprot:NP_001343778.1 Uncharacterized protein CELE_T05B9.2 [Caenorhabditis elegans]